MSLYLIANVDVENDKMTLYNQDGFSCDSREPAVIIHKDREEEICVYKQLFDFAYQLNSCLIVEYNVENGAIVKDFNMNTIEMSSRILKIYDEERFLSPEYIEGGN